jgi:dihydroxy-acid dehydratase
MSEQDQKTAGSRRYSSVVVDGVEHAPSRAMLRAVGFTDKDFTKSQIGIASTWSMVTPCNMHIDALAKEAALGADEAGAKAVLFNTITVSDGISMGTPGMRYSLVSREVIADSIETVVGAEGFDGFVAIGGCDKNMPGCVMAMARMDRPAVFVYGGTIQPGAERRDIVSVFEAVGGVASGAVSPDWDSACRTAPPRKRYLRRNEQIADRPVPQSSSWSSGASIRRIFFAAKPSRTRLPR